MGNFFQRLSEKMRRFMEGRYGSDRLNRFLLGLALVFLVLNIFLRRVTPVFSVLIWVLLILTYLRMFSRNISKRYNENTRYLQLRERVLDFLKGKRSSDRSKKIFKCPACRQKVRVPRGRGRVAITCPRCGREFVRRT